VDVRLCDPAMLSWGPSESKPHQALRGRVVAIQMPPKTASRPATRSGVTGSCPPLAHARAPVQGRIVKHGCCQRDGSRFGVAQKFDTVHGFRSSLADDSMRGATDPSRTARTRVRCKNFFVSTTGARGINLWMIKPLQRPRFGAVFRDVSRVKKSKHALTPRLVCIFHSPSTVRLKTAAISVP